MTIDPADFRNRYGIDVEVFEGGVGRPESAKEKP